MKTVTGPLANHGPFQRVSVPIGCSMLRFLETGDVTTSRLVVKTSDVLCVLKLASGDLTSLVAGDSQST